MYDDLARIESCYGCVAEYNRCKQERDEYEWEKKQSMFEYCKANEKKFNDNKDITVCFSDDCIGCEHYEDIGPLYWDEDIMHIDDVEHGLCHNCNRNECEEWKRMKGE